jgi:two-component system cell cycle sensor histidine kinase/response regulator CckA
MDGAERSQAGRISEMIDVVKKAAAGEVPTRIEPAGENDELDRLAEAINGLIEQVDERIAECQRVQDELRLVQFCVERASIGIFWIGPDARIRNVNGEAHESLGYTREELRQLSVFDIDPTFSPERWVQHRENLRAQGSLTFEAVHRRKDGTTFPVEITTNYIEYQGQGYSFSFVRDITERKRMEQALHLTQFCVDRASVGIIRTGPDARILSVNDQACRNLGYTREELLKMYVFDIDPAFSRKRWLGHRRDLRARGSNTFETIHRRKDGTTFPVEITGTYLEFQGEGFSFSFVRDITVRKQMEQALHLTQFCVNQASVGILRTALDGRILSVNDHICRSLGYTREELLKMYVFDLDPYLSREEWLEHRRDLRARGSRTVERAHRRKDGTIFPIEIAATYLEYQGEEFAFSFIHDITERKQLEERLLQAQKMEAIGRLAGGVAHDFNNMLTVILGYAELIKARLPHDDPLAKDVSEIQKAAGHSKDITRQLLAFSRKQMIAPKLVNLNELIANTKGALSRLIGEDIDFRFHAAPDLWGMRFDPSQVDQILVNLAVNARDAMPGGGALTVETANVRLDERYCRDHLDCAPGYYVFLGVSDDGVGMDKETLSHLFEPFFTTKEVGRGTGLGLATIYGIVKQNGGIINVYSEPGQGTTFKIYFPAVAQKDEVAEKPDESAMAAGSGTVLLVEDDDMVREMTATMLQTIGYTVQVAETASDALSLCERRDAQIDLLMTDVVMPGMSGTELRDKVEAFRPGIKVLFTSGYTSNIVVQRGMLEEHVHFLQKPFSINHLARKVREAIEGS